MQSVRGEVKKAARRREKERENHAARGAGFVPEKYPYQDVLLTSSHPQQLIDTEPPLPPPPPPLLSGEGLGLPDGPHNATASVLDHRMIAFTDQQHLSPMRAQHGILPDAPAELATRRQHAHQHAQRPPGPGPALLPPGTGLQGGDRHQDRLQAFPAIPSSALQARPDWFLFDSSSSNSPTPFLQPIDPFLTHSGTNVVDFGLGVPVEDFTTHVDASITPLPPLSGTSSNFNFDFDFNSPIWEPPMGDGVTLSPGIGPMPYSGAGVPDNAEAYSTTTDPSRATMTSAQRHRNPSWLDDDDLTSHRDRDLQSAQSSRGATNTGRRRQKKGKARDDSTTASGSVRSASITSTQDAYPFPDPAVNPSNPLIPSSGSDRRRSTRTKTRAKSVATTASASSSSTAPTPSSVSATSAAGPSTAPPPTAASTAATPRSVSTAAANQSRLRSASRASKNSVSRPSDTPEERRTRASHNLVEKQYRSRLNAQFEGLLSALPDLTTGRGAGDSKEGETTETASPKGDAGEAGEGDQSERKVSKAEVLERARLHIEMLERESEALRREREELLANLIRAESEMVSSGGEGLEEFLRRSGQGQDEGLELKEEGEEEEEDKEVKRE